jgi:hypothetical protein
VIIPKADCWFDFGIGHPMSITSTNEDEWEEGLEPFVATPENKRSLEWFRDYLTSDDNTSNGLLGKLRTNLAVQGPVGDEKSWTQAQLRWIKKALHPDKIRLAKLAPLDFFFKRVSAFLSPLRDDCALPFKTTNKYGFVWNGGLSSYTNRRAFPNHKVWREARNKHVQEGLSEKRVPKEYGMYFVDLTRDVNNENSSREGAEYGDPPDDEDNYEDEDDNNDDTNEMDLDPPHDQNCAVINFAQSLIIKRHEDAAKYCPLCETEMSEEIRGWVGVNMLDHITSTERAEKQPHKDEKKKVVMNKTRGYRQVLSHTKCHIWSLHRFNHHVEQEGKYRKRSGHHFRTLIPFFLNKTVNEYPLIYPDQQTFFKIDHLAKIIQERFDYAIRLTGKGGKLGNNNNFPLTRLEIGLSKAETAAVTTHWKRHKEKDYDESQQIEAQTLYLKHLFTKLRDAMIAGLSEKRFQDEAKKTTTAVFLNGFNSVFSGKESVWKNNQILPSAEEFLEE